MARIRLLAAFLLLSALPTIASAEYTPKYQKALQVINAQFTDRQFDIWTNVEGDLNGDGLQDLALILTRHLEQEPREERLVVLNGTADGNYSVLSLSGEFCGVRKFYNLSTSGRSLFIEAVLAIRSENADTFTLQFRYNPRINDLELIGKESVEHDGNIMYKVSINYLTGIAIHFRKEGKKQKLVKAPLNKPTVLRLQGFDCSTYDSMEPSIYITKKFEVERY